MKTSKIRYRERIPGKEARENRINLRYNDSEYALILKRANKAGLPVSNYAAQKLLEDTPRK